MARGPEYYPSKGTCIYCMSSNVQLKDEHIIPYSLGGLHVLRSASCADCEDITKKFEQKVARDLWGDARTSFNAPTRRKKERKSHIEVNAGSRNLIKRIPASEYPAGFVFYKMGLCGLLQGLPEENDISTAWQMVVIDDDERRNTYFHNHGHYPPIKFRHVPYEFGRLLAKIGYCQLLTALDLEDFHPIALPYITGTKKNVSYIVGSKDGKPEAENGYRLTTMYTENINPMLLLVEIRLYANTGSPTYHVVVGSQSDPEKILLIKKKLLAAA